MSISDPRLTKDRSDKTVDVCDIAINPKFLVRIQLFKDFFMQIVIEGMSEKYNVQLSMEETIIVNNSKFIGTLVTHRVRNEDMNRAQSASGVPAALNSRDVAIAPENFGKLEQKIDEKDATAIRRSLFTGHRIKKLVVEFATSPLTKCMLRSTCPTT